MIEKDQLFNQCLSEFQINNPPIRDIYEYAITYSSKDNPLELKEDRIKRIMVNEIRHLYTNYDESLQKIKRLKRSDEIYYYLYKNHVLHKIQENYKYLEDECQKQKTKLIIAKRV